ncbi:histidine kinase dimerization/phospho-acceptor domain-containing protein [Methylopila sp. M107]|uniref:sensor histidine kinase n=1 Tax=Methylopila sp. M107 TaxID=1101190 RepID=UPI00037DAE09|nr:histidine kinase dimerization/phospho-acceptor domain-containing protein [Methylopila sp. M107]
MADGLMTDELSEIEAASGDETLLGAEAAGRPAFAVDADGEIVWAGDAAFGLIATGELDAATRRTLARMAASGAGGLLRLKLGDAGARPLLFQARPIDRPGAGPLLGLAGLAPAPAAPAVASPTAPPVASAEEAPPARDVAAEEGAKPDGPAEEAAVRLLARQEAEDLSPEELAPDDLGRDDLAAEAKEPENTAPEAQVLEAPTREDLTPKDLTPEDLDPAPESQDPVAAEAVEPEAADAPVVTSVAPGVFDEDRPPDPRRDFGPLRAEPGAAPALREAAAEPFRFAFETDAAARLTLLSPELERAVGPNASASVGRPWRDVAADLGLDPEGAVEAALARRGAWSDIDILWPVDDGRRLPLSLSALPMFDRGRSFVGFRGLGRSVGEPFAPTERDASEAPAVAEEAAPVADAAPEPVDVSVEPEAPAADETIDLASPKPEARPEPPILVEIAPEQPVFAGNVVALRDAPLRETPPRFQGLSSSEESAFDEIARRLQGLGVRVGGPDDPAVLALERETAEDQRELPFAAGLDEVLRLLDRLPIGALVLRGGDVAHANRTALELLGCRELGDLTGRGADTLFAEPLPQDRDAPAGVMRLIAANGGEVEVEARLSAIAWGGAPATLVTLRRPEGAVAAAKETERRERELSAVLDVAADGVFTLDGSGRILSVNRRAEALFGFDGREVQGSLFTLSLAPESRRAAFDRLDALGADDAQPDGGAEVLGLSRHGGSLPLLMTIGRIAGGEGDRFCAVLRDIGPWKRAEEELIAARRQAERANAQKSEFLAKVGHEIRTPLNAIIGFAEVMMEERLGPIGSPRYKDYLKDIHTSGGHLVKMVDDLLDISRIETGKLKLDFVAVDLNEIASQAAALLQPQANRDRVIIRTSLARGLPHVLADRRSVRQIMTNLAANAVKLSRPGGQVIVATAFGDAGQAVFRVRDAGAGMSKQEIARAFEPFRPLAVADNDTGFGLGLPLTRALAEANEAALALQSEVGQGTLAEVTFPASRVLAG